jgi:hypothetical protein
LVPKDEFIDEYTDKFEEVFMVTVGGGEVLVKRPLKRLLSKHFYKNNQLVEGQISTDKEGRKVLLLIPKIAF